MHRIVFALAVVVLVAVSAGRVEASDATVPLVLGHNGRLLDGADQPVNASVKMTFELHATSDVSVNAPKWQETRDVSVTNGVYGVVLGDTRPGAGGTALPPELLAQTELWLQVRVRDTALVPRLRIASVPYALRTGRAAETETVLAGGVNTAALRDKSVTTEKIADGAITPSKLAIAGGKFTGLDADTLDGLDSSAFAPAGVVETIGAPPAGSSIASELAAVRATLGTPTAASVSADLLGLGTDLTATRGLATSIGATVTTTASDVADLKTTLGTLRSSTGSTLGADVSAIKGQADTLGTDLGTVKSELGTWATSRSLAATLTAQRRYSQKCDPAVDTFLRDAYPGLGDAQLITECLHDGRWHLVGNMLDVLTGKMNPGSFGGMQAGITNYSGLVQPAQINSWNSGWRVCYGLGAVGDANIVQGSDQTLVQQCVAVTGKLFTVTHIPAFNAAAVAYEQRDYATLSSANVESSMPCTNSGARTSCGNSESFASFWNLYVRQ